MRNRGLVVAIVTVWFGCFSTARYDLSHVQRVSDINARFDAELVDEGARFAASLAELEQRRVALVSTTDDAGSEAFDQQAMAMALAQQHTEMRAQLEQQR